MKSKRKTIDKKTLMQKEFKDIEFKKLVKHIVDLETEDATTSERKI